MLFTQLDKTSTSFRQKLNDWVVDTNKMNSINCLFIMMFLFLDVLKYNIYNQAVCGGVWRLAAPQPENKCWKLETVPLISWEPGLEYILLWVKAIILKSTFDFKLKYSQTSFQSKSNYDPGANMQTLDSLPQYRWLTTCWKRCSGSSSSSCQPPPSLRWPWCRLQDKHHPGARQKTPD